MRIWIFAALLAVLPFSANGEEEASYRPLESLGSGLRHLGDETSWIVLGKGALAVAVARPLDEDVRELFSKQHRWGDAEKLGNDILGTGVPGVLLGAGFWLYGDLRGSSRALHAGQAQIEALFVTGLATAAIKGLSGRERPDGSDKYSFPSGHTSTVFASATVLQEFYGWKAGLPAYLLGIATMQARIADDRHWLTDTIAGAALGIWIGQAIARSHSERIEGSASVVQSKPENRVKIAPILAPGTLGLGLTTTW